MYNVKGNARMRDVNKRPDQMHTHNLINSNLVSLILAFLCHSLAKKLLLYKE